MVNLLKDEYKKTKYVKEDKKDKDEAAAFPAAGEAAGANEQPIGKIDPKKYKDLEGITIPKLEMGFWFIKNQPVFYKIILSILFAIGLLTLPRFLWTFGYYVMFGMAQDRELAQALTDQSNDLHGIVMEQAAKDIVPLTLDKIKNDVGTYDILVKIKNPNPKHWGNFEYYFTNGTEKFGRADNFIYPGEEKYIVSPAISAEKLNANINFVVDKADWRRITAHEIADWAVYKADRFQVNVKAIEFTPSRATILSEKLNLNELSFTAENNSAFNYYECGFLALLYSQNDAVSASYVTVDNFMSGTEQNIAVTIPGNFGRVTDIDIFPNLDIYSADNFIRFDGGAGEER